MDELKRHLEQHRDDVIRLMVETVERDEKLSPGMIGMLANVETCLKALEGKRGIAV